MSQVRWKYTGQQIWWEEEQEEQLQSPQMSCPIPAPGHSHLPCACRSQFLNLKQPESSFETAAKPLGYMCMPEEEGNTSPLFPSASLAVLDVGSNSGTHQTVPTFPFSCWKQHGSSSKRSGLGASVPSLGYEGSHKQQRVPLEQTWVDRHCLT